MINNFDYSQELLQFGFINAETTPLEFDSNLKEEGDYSPTCDPLTALGAAALAGNILLIEHIFAKGGKSLLTAGRLSPLHLACCCEDDSKAYKAAKKLLDLGSPVNCFKEPDPEFDEVCSTPLDLAADSNNIKTAGLLLRRGGVPSGDGYIWSKFLLEDVQNAIIPESLKQFKMHFSSNETFPNEIINHILSLSNAAELQD